jgi:uncharacterized membrane protein
MSEEEMEGMEPEEQPEEEKSAPEPDMGGMDVSDDDKLWMLLAYIFSPLVPIILMLMEDKKNRPFIRAHNAQALVWGVLAFIASVLTSFLCGILGLIMWIAAIYWGWQAYQGQMVTIPVITDFVKQQGWA